MKNEIMKKISKGEIKMKPRWEFVARTLGLRGMWWLIVSGAAWSILGIGYFLDLYNPAELAEFGEIGRRVFLEDFPYYWLIGSIVLLIAAIKLMSKLGENYKKTTRLTILLTGLAAIMVTGLMILVKNFLL